MVDTSKYLLLNRVFTRNTLSQLLDGGHSDSYDAALKRFLAGRDNLCNGEYFHALYDVLKHDYRNEYYFKNTLLNKLLIREHSLRTTTALTEVPVARSKADFLIINGKAVVYEIKTGLDNFERLPTQLSDYYKAFKEVVIVSTEENSKVLHDKYDDTDIGIYTITHRGALLKEKKPEPCSAYLDKEVIFKVLRKPEFELLIMNLGYELPKVNSFKYYRACLNVFESIDIDLIYDEFCKILKKRISVRANEFRTVPDELKFLIYFSNYKEKDYKRLASFLTV